MIWRLQLPWLLVTVLATTIIVSATVSLWRVWNPHIVILHLGANGELEVESKVGVRETAIVLPQSTVLAGLIVLLMRVGRRGEHLILLSDSMQVSAHRRLRQWLRWQSQATLG